MSNCLRSHGFLRYGHEVHAAVVAAGLNMLEGFVMLEVVNQIFGPDPSPTLDVVLSPTALGRRWHQHRSSFGHALASLVSAGILTRTEGGYRFVSDPASWRRGDRPRITPAVLASIADAGRTALAPPTRPLPLAYAAGPVTGRPAPPTTVLAQPTTVLAQPTTAPLSPGTTDSLSTGTTNPPRASYLGNLRMEEKNNTHTGAEDGPYMGDGSAGSTDRREERSDPGAAPIDAVRDVGPIYPPGCDPRAPGLPSPENVEKVRRALGYLNANFDGNKDFYALANVVNGTQGGFNPDWLLSALVVLKLSDPRMHTRRYLLGILRGFGQAGGPTPEEQARAEAVFNPVSSDPAAAASAAESEEVLNARATARMIAYLKNNPTPSYG